MLTNLMGAMADIMVVTISTVEVSVLCDAAGGAGRIGSSPNSADLAAGLGGLIDRSRLRGFDKKKCDGLDEQNSKLHGGQGRSKQV